MVKGVGIDIVEIKRFKDVKQSFVNRVFSEKEIEYFASKSLPEQSMAGNFAAKEAFSKAIGTGIRGFDIKDVEILRNNLGMPYIKLNPPLNEKYEKYCFDVSISHEKDFAVSIVVMQDKEWNLIRHYKIT